MSEVREWHPTGGIPFGIPSLSGGVIDEQHCESLPYLDNSSEHRCGVVEFGEGRNCHHLSDSAESEHLPGLQLLHVVQTLRDALESVCHHVVETA